jgi:hypothetical protein
MKTFLLATTWMLLTVFALSIQAEDEALKKFNEMAEAAEEQRSHMRQYDSDRVLTPVVDGLISENTHIRKRAVQILEGPYLKYGWLALDHFERLTWEKLDARGRGMYLWCWATHRRWENPAPGRPLPQSITRTLWTKAAKEPVPLPYLKETAALLFKRKRSANHPPAPIGDLLEADDRQRLAQQYLSVFESCVTEMERVGVCWMILDLHGNKDDTMLLDWYSTQTRPEQRVQLLKVLKQIAAPSKETDVRISRVSENAKGRLLERMPILMGLAQVAARDWDVQAAHEGSVLFESLKELAEEQKD